jgi:hypothetical protein
MKNPANGVSSIIKSTAKEKNKDLSNHKNKAFHPKSCVKS